MSQPHRESFCIGTTKGILSVVPTLSVCLLLSGESERWQAGSPPVCGGQGSSGQAYYTLWGLCIAYSVVWRMYTHLYKKGIQGHTRAYKGIRPRGETKGPPTSPRTKVLAPSDCRSCPPSNQPVTPYLAQRQSGRRGVCHRRDKGLSLTWTVKTAADTPRFATRPLARS